MKCSTYCLGDLVKIKYGKNQKHVVSDEGKIPIYGTGGIMGYATEFLYDKPSVLIGRKGTIGKVKYADHPFWTVDTLFYTEVNEEIVLPKFLFYLMSQLDLNNYNEGTTIPSLRTETLNRLEFSIPPLPIQRKIASILSALDDKIETNNAICRNLEEQAMALYKSWFIDFEPFANQEFFNSEIGIIPKDWSVEKLSKIATVVTGKRPKRKTTERSTQENVPILGASGIMGYTSESMYCSKILVIGRVGTLGVVQRFEKDCWPSDNALVIQSDYYEYVKQVLVRFDYSSINRGSTQPLITQTDIKNICILIPPQHILKQFEYRVGKSMNLYSLLINETRKLEEMRNTLLPKLMRGELAVESIN
ncbi:MAG: restriction endonuclease subunit S [Akkermansia sp.]|nr:restriction endonuclease subunit S [Akkermansia sp.]